jgi:magnesium transporter
VQNGLIAFAETGRLILKPVGRMNLKTKDVKQPVLRIQALTTDHRFVTDLSLEQLTAEDILWYWVDFSEPSEQESDLLRSYFHFHPLSIEDCLYFIQRPKLDHFADYHFFVLHALNRETLDAVEVDLFVAEKYIVSYHKAPLQEIDEVWGHLPAKGELIQTTMHIASTIIDKLVDFYFPIVDQMEDRLALLGEHGEARSLRRRLDRVFQIRNDLLKVRHSIFPMRDLVYRMLNSTHLEGLEEHRFYLADIHDHLLKLSEMIERNREMTSDLRDSYMSINTNRTNTIMTTLTVITTIFMPLTFIAGIYGMNFKYMPELEWHYGYFIVQGLMAAISILMIAWFKKKGWFNED